MHLAPLIHDLAIVLGVAAVVTLIFQRIRQPVVLGYLVAGMIVGPHTPPYSMITDLPNIQIWAELGVIFLMFSLGLEFSFRKLASVGAPASVTALLEVVFMLALGYGCGRLLGWGFNDSLFLGAMLSISSTTIILKALDEFGLKTRRFAELVLGVLIVEDLAAILLLVGLTTVASSNQFSAWVLLSSAGKLALVVGSWFLVGYFAVPRFVRYVGRTGNDEMLTVVSTGLCLALVVVAASFQYSVALGAFIMGSILAESVEAHRIEHLIKPLRDLFAAVFFVSVGILIDPTAIWNHAGAIALITLATVTGKILVTSLGSLLTGQSIKVSTQVGFSLAQIGEFSFIIAGLGVTLKATSEFLYPIGVAVSVLTTFLTPYLIRASEPLAARLEGSLSPKVINALRRYSNFVERRRADRRDSAQRQRRWLTFVLNGVAVTLVFVLVAEVMAPFLGRELRAESWQSILGWATAMALAAPFIWGMLMRSGTRSLLTLLWVAALSLEFFAARYIVLVVGVLGLALPLLFHRRLGETYHWLERQFIAPFEAKAAAAKGVSPLVLAPWDAHLISLKVHPNAEFAGKKLANLELRNRLGINVVAIHRGDETILPPDPQEALLPHDELLVLGTDEQVERSRALIERRPAHRPEGRALGVYQLANLLVGEGAVVVGKSIRSAGIRERFRCIVVGVERGQSRFINPDSNLAIEARDILWVVGDAEALRRLTGEFSTRPAAVS